MERNAAVGCFSVMFYRHGTILVELHFYVKNRQKPSDSGRASSNLIVGCLVFRYRNMYCACWVLLATVLLSSTRSVRKVVRLVVVAGIYGYAQNDPLL